jgi:hypothetical protein
MKIKLLMIGLSGLISATAFAQKGELNNAQSEYDKYESMRGQKAAVIVASANASLANAKTSIDKASANEKTGSLPLTYALKGTIYSALAVQDTVPATAEPAFSTAEEALKKAKELDTKGENKKMIDGAYLNLAQYKLNSGIKEYQNKVYDQAYKSFDFYRTVLPEDTNAIYYTALAAANAGNKDAKFYPLAITNYNKLVTTKYSGNAKVYLDLSSLYLLSKDTVNAIKAADDGVAKYPANAELRKREIEIALQTGKQSDILVKIQGAIANDPKNKTLYYYAGLTYSQLGDADNAKSLKATDDASKNTLHPSALDNYSKGGDMYKKALEVDPDYFEANLNYGYVLIRPAIDLYNAANKLPANKEKEYQAAIAKSNAQFDVAKPYLLKAVELNPKSVDALTNLRSYYRGYSDKAHTAEYSAKAADLKKQIDALSTGN